MKNLMKNTVTIIAITLTILLVWQVNALSQDSDIVCTMEYAPVCWMPYFKCPDGALCSRPMDVTYSNMCMLNAANATLQHKWVCEYDKSKACTKEYSPVCWETPPKACLSIDCAVHNETYSNKCMMENAGSTFLYEWECKTELPEATDKKYYVWDTQKCMIIRYMCEDEWRGFSDRLWCGCEKNPVTPKIEERIDTVLDKFMQKLESGWYSQNAINSAVRKLSESLQKMRKTKPEYWDIIHYALQKLDSY